MHCKIFYSWQSDLPNKTNRGFIEKALEDAAKSIHNDNTIEVYPVIDRDIKDVPGSPDIAHTIFSKIENSHIFVCDVSIINQNTQSRPTPNPNVLLELGYAIKTLGWGKIIMVMNLAFGKPEELPFDLRPRAVKRYYMPEESQDRATARKQLQSQLEDEMRSILAGLKVQTPGEVIQQPSIVEQTINAIENSQPNQASLVRQFMTSLRDKLDALNPDFSKGDIYHDDFLIQSIEKTTEIVIDFAHVAEVIATMNNSEAAFSLYKSFGIILERYNLPMYFSSSDKEYDSDLYKFIGQELFITFFSFLIREERWKIIAEIIKTEIYVDKQKIYHRSSLLPFTYISDNLDLLEKRQNRLKLNKISLHADIINQRHTKGQLAKIVPIKQFIDADWFLFLRSEFQNPEATQTEKWKLSTLPYIKEEPKFLLEATSMKYAEELLNPLGIKDIRTFKIYLFQVCQKLIETFNEKLPYSHPVRHFGSLNIGYRP